MMDRGYSSADLDRYITGNYGEDQFPNGVEEEEELEEEELSNCCSAPIIMEDICSACKEHCEPQEEED